MFTRKVTIPGVRFGEVQRDPIQIRKWMIPCNYQPVLPHIRLNSKLPPRPKLKEEDLTEAFIKGSGPGGQKINKTACAVQMKHLPTGLWVKCQETRSREQNRSIARKWLADKVDMYDRGENSRINMINRVKIGKKASKKKKSRRKYRALDEAKNVVEEGELGEEDEGIEGEEGKGEEHDKEKEEEARRGRDGEITIFPKQTSDSIICDSTKS